MRQIDVLYRGRIGDYAATYSGRRIYPLDPSYADFDIGDIAQGLSNCCRYAGQCEQFYSVAEHSVRGSRRAEEAFGKKVAKEFLLHDAAEAYCGDVVGPFLKYLPEYKAFRDKLQLAINVAFGIPSGMSVECKEVDLRMLVSEGPWLFYTDDRWWLQSHYPKPYQDEFSEDEDPLTPYEARLAFMARWKELKDVQCNGLR